MNKKNTFEILEKIGLSSLSRCLPTALPHGDKKRLEMGIALASDPDLLMLDEPTAGLSIGESKEIMDLVQNLAKQHGLTVFFTEHDMKVVFSVSERIIVMHNGSLIADGIPEVISGNAEVQNVYLGGR